MTREEILGLEIKDLIELINEETAKGIKVVEVAQNLGIGEKTLRERAKAGGYSFSRKENKYIAGEAQEMTAVTREEKKEDDQSQTAVTQEEKKTDDQSHTKNDDSSHQKKIIKSKRPAPEDEGVKALLEINKSIQGIVELLGDSKRAQGAKEIIIDLEEEEETRTTIRVNAGAWRKFESFTLKNSEYKKKDLLSMALLEYIQNHK